MAGEREQSRETVCPPDSYIYMQNVGKGGLISVYRGPTVVNQTGQDQPVRYDAQTRTYRPCTLEQATQNFLRAAEGDYIILENPSEDGGFPSEVMQQTRPLIKGRKRVIPGPWSEALWPGQIATVIEGHRLQSNQYLVAIVYNAEEAEKNWASVKTAAPSAPSDETSSGAKKLMGLPKPASFEVGTRIIIKGSDVSFFIPCTGVEVLKDENGKYIRQAVTLEQLQYCCLVDEDGKKIYPRGPAVVFPLPTQQFVTDRKGRRIFRPIELNRINGIHLKVTADFTGPDIENDPSKERDFTEGEELFVTGKTLSIYYPREEFSIIEYGQGNKKHFSTAIPKGEARYVIKRETGEIKLIRGPFMLLADPRFDLPVRRVLSVDEVKLWYPGNNEAVKYNQQLAQVMAESPSSRSGLVSEGDFRKNMAKMRGLSPSPEAYLGGSTVADMGMEDYSVEEIGDEAGASESITRGTSYTQPRTVTLDTKYDGVPRIEVWSGFAVLIVGSVGSRRVVQGPQPVLLEYDERLGFMELSTGKPKNSDTLFKTAYLKVQNNQVGDIVSFESKDHVKGTIKISLRVNFEAETEEDKLKWFAVDNYVKYLTDHVRSIIAGTTKKRSIAEIKGDYVNIVRDAILGPKAEGKERNGLAFSDNGMRVVEVEVLDINLLDQGIAKLLDQAQHKVVESNIEVEQNQKDLEVTRIKEEIVRSVLMAQFETIQLKNSLERKAIEEKIELLVSQNAQAMKQIEGEAAKTKALEEINDFKAEANLERAKMETAHQHEVDTQKQSLALAQLVADTEAAVKRLEAAKEGFADIFIGLSKEDMVAKLAQAVGYERMLTGGDLASSILNVVGASPIVSEFFARTDAARKASEKNRLTGTPAGASGR